MDGITLLRADHRSVEKLFKEFENAGPRAVTKKDQLVRGMIEQLAVHAAIEEQVFYPAVREAVKDTTSVVLEALEEHHIVKWVLSELEGMKPGDERYDAKVTVLTELVRHHVEEEETDLFPKVREALGRKQLASIGETMEAAKALAPTRPHPRSPDTPPGNLVVGAVAGVVDKARSAGRSTVRKASGKRT